jgi:pilus assembly protein Flp/PilA
MRMKDDSGASAVEYGLIVVAIAAVVVAVVVALGGTVHSLFTDSCTKLNGLDTTQTCPS